MPKLLKFGVQVEEAPEFSSQTAIQIFESMQFEDLVEDGNLREVAHYLRGSKWLRIPPAWRHVLPSEL